MGNREIKDAYIAFLIAFVRGTRCSLQKGSNHVKRNVKISVADHAQNLGRMLVFCLLGRSLTMLEQLIQLQVLLIVCNKYLHVPVYLLYDLNEQIIYMYS